MEHAAAVSAVDHEPRPDAWGKHVHQRKHCLGQGGFRTEQHTSLAENKKGVVIFVIAFSEVVPGSTRTLTSGSWSRSESAVIYWPRL